MLLQIYGSREKPLLAVIIYKAIISRSQVNFFLLLVILGKQKRKHKCQRAQIAACILYQLI